MRLPRKKSKRDKCVFYVSRNAIAYYSKNDQKPLVLELGPEIVKDMEIISPEKFIQTLSFWVDNNKILECDVVIVLSEDVYFEHAAQSLAGGEDTDKEIEMFMDTVPFEQSVSRVVVDDASKRAVVLSRDYYDLLLEFLEKRYFRVLALFPMSLIKIKSPEEIKPDQLMKKLDEYKKYNFLSDFERRFVPESFVSKPKDTKNLKIMVGVFGFLLVVLAVVIYFGMIRKG